MSEADPSHLRVRRSTIIGLVIGGLAYFGSLLNYSTDLTRTASAPGYWSNLYDLQGRAILSGHLWVPKGPMGIEGIVHDGHTYMYYPPFPALLRLPVLLVTNEFDGKLTLASMALAWVVLAVMATRLFWLVRRLVTGRESVSRVEAVLGAIFLAAATGGTVLTYDASLPWVYHEAYVWAAAVAVGATYWLVRVMSAPDLNAVRWLGVFVLLCVLTRATEGWALGVVTIGVGLWAALRRGPVDLHRWGVRIILAGLVPVLVGVLISELKFDTLWLHPLQDQVWTSVNAHRRAALAANGGSLTGTQFFLTSLVAYFRPDGIRFVEHFPWITLPADPAASYGGAFIDQTYRTGSVTAFMTLLLVLTVVAAVALLLPRRPVAYRALRWPLVAGVLVTGGVMGYGYYSYRYATDFVPALIMGGAVGFALVGHWTHERPRWTRVLVPVFAVGVAFSIVANLTTGFAAYAFNHGGPPLRTYVSLQEHLTPGAARGLVTHVDTPPTKYAHGHTDELAVLGDCTALYVDTGDLYRPWSTVAMRDHVYTVTPSAVPDVGTYPIFTIQSVPQGEGLLQVRADGRARVVLVHDDDKEYGAWHPVVSGRSITLRLSSAPESEVFHVHEGAKLVGSLPDSYHDVDWYYDNVLPRLAQPQDAVPAVATSALTVQESLGPAPALCRRLTD